MRFDQSKGIYRDCKWCKGVGCLYCSAEAKKAYDAAFPGGARPFATFDITTTDRVKKARNAIGRESLEHAFGPDGDGLAEILRKCADELLATKEG